jgi:hypothetical protein
LQLQNDNSATEMQIAKKFLQPYLILHCIPWIIRMIERNKVDNRFYFWIVAQSKRKNRIFFQINNIYVSRGEKSLIFKNSKKMFYCILFYCEAITEISIKKKPTTKTEKMQQKKEAFVIYIIKCKCIIV